MDNNKTGRFIAACRKKKNMTQQQLADMLGITNKAVSKWESGNGMPDISILTKLSDVLGVSIDAIIRGDDREALSEPPTKDHEAALFAAEMEGVPSLFKKQCKYKKVSNVAGNTIAYLSFLLLLFIIAGFIVTKWVHYTGNSTAFYALFFILTFVILLFDKGHLLKAQRKYKKFTRTNGINRTIVYAFFESGFKIKTSTYEKTYLYEHITNIIHSDEAIVFRCHQEDFMIDESGVQNTDELLQFLKKKSASAKQIHISKKQRNFRRIGLVASTFGLLLAAMQVAYLTIGAHYRIAYIHNEWFYVFNACFISLLFAGAILFVYKNRKILIPLIVAAVVLLCMNTMIAMEFDTTVESNVSTSDRGGNVLVLKRDTKTGKTDVYRKEILWFARLKTSLPYTIGDEEIKLQWLTNDSCSVTYLSPDDGNIHQYVATYGDRGSGYSYYNVTTVLASIRWAVGPGWVTDSIKDWSFSNNSNGFTIYHGGIREDFRYDECIQYGTIAVVLCKDGIPKWTIALNEDCFVDGGGLTDTGSITICQVSMEMTVPVVFTSIKYSETERG